MHIWHYLTTIDLNVWTITLMIDGCLFCKVHILCGFNFAELGSREEARDRSHNTMGKMLVYSQHTLC